MRRPPPPPTSREEALLSELQVAARDIEPGDHLPPQRALHGTPYQHNGFAVGRGGRDVLPGLAVLPGRMLLFGSEGTLDSIAPDTTVTVWRRDRDADHVARGDRYAGP